MSLPNYTLDPKAAKAGSGGSGRIDTTAKYKGKIKFCSCWQSDNGASMVKIKFESDDGQTSDIQICTHSGNAKGNKETYGFKQFQAVMACLKLRNLTPMEATVEDYDRDQQQMAQVSRTVFKEMTGAKIGLALYRHDQTSNQGNDFFSMDIAAPFNYDSEQVAQEILDNQPATKLSKIVMSMKDKDSRTSGGGGAQTGDGYGSYQEAGGGFEDDIPFS